MRYVINFLTVLFFSILFNSQVLAINQSPIISLLTPPPTNDYDLPYPGLLPDHPLYLIKALRDRILLFVTHDRLKKVQLNLLFGDKRLVMGQLLWEKGSLDLSSSTFTKAEKYLLSASLGLVMLKKQNSLPPGIADKVELAAKKHEEVILKLINITSDEVRKQNLNQSLGVNHQATQQIQLTK